MKLTLKLCAFALISVVAATHVFAQSDKGNGNQRKETRTKADPDFVELKSRKSKVMFELVLPTVPPKKN